MEIEVSAACELNFFHLSLQMRNRVCLGGFHGTQDGCTIKKSLLVRICTDSEINRNMLAFSVS